MAKSISWKIKTLSNLDLENRKLSKLGESWKFSSSFLTAVVKNCRKLKLNVKLGGICMKKEELKQLLYVYKIRLKNLEDVEKSLNGEKLCQNLWKQIELLEKIKDIECELYHWL